MSSKIVVTPNGVWSIVQSVLVALGLFTALVLTGVSVGLNHQIISQLNNQETILETIPVTPPLISPFSSCPAKETRRNDAYIKRLEAAADNYARGYDCHANNGDETLYASYDYYSQFSKGLPHNPVTGRVTSSAYEELLVAMENQSGFDSIPLDVSNTNRPLVNPRAGLAFDLIGSDAQQYSVPPAPTFASAEAAGELVQSYWMALTRDVSFADYGTNPLIALAIQEITNLTDYRGPSPVTTANLFRGTAPGCDVGPYLSQFFYLDCPFGANTIDQKILPATAGLDFVKNWTLFVGIQNGAPPTETATFESTKRYMINGRDLARWVHIDVLWQAYFQAALLLMGTIGAPLNPTNPYLAPGDNEQGFATFGGPHIATLVTEVATRALHACWYQKWFVNRRLRPEAFAGQFYLFKSGGSGYFPANPFHIDLLLSSLVTNRSAWLVHNITGSYLLPQAFPEGSPIHPSFVAGHATVAGACVTILKALFDGSFVITSPVEPSANGSTLNAYSGPALTVNGELNKLAANVAIGRNIAGVHYESDARESLLLGEKVAIATLRDYKKTFKEPFVGWTFEDFLGNVINV